MDLSNLRPADGSKQSDNFRRGRGHGSGNGKTAGKGHKGQKARSGGTRPGFEGGQMPLYRRIPKRGFTNRNTKTIVGINVSALEVFENDTVVTVDTLIEQGIVTNPKDGVKILGNGELTKKLTVQADAFSAGAVAKIEALDLISMISSIFPVRMSLNPATSSPVQMLARITGFICSRSYVFFTIFFLNNPMLPPHLRISSVTRSTI